MLPQFPWHHRHVDLLDSLLDNIDTRCQDCNEDKIFNHVKGVLNLPSHSYRAVAILIVSSRKLGALPERIGSIAKTTSCARLTL